jgi:predicted ester cyclase
MSTKDLKALERRFVNEFNKGKAAAMAVIDELIATNNVSHTASGMDIHGLKGIKQIFNDWFDAFPDYHMTIDDIVAEGDKAVIRLTWTGTHKGAYMGIPPTNKKVTMWGIEIDRLVGGKCVEAWARMDTLGFMQQLGVIPMPKK